MATRADNDVTLTHDDAERVTRHLRSYIDKQRNYANTTKNAALRQYARVQADDAERLVVEITKNLWTWED